MKEGLVVSGDRNLMFWMEERKMVSKEIVFGMYIRSEASLEENCVWLRKLWKKPSTYAAVTKKKRERERERERLLVLWILN